MPIAFSIKDALSGNKDIHWQKILNEIKKSENKSVWNNDEKFG